MRAASLHQLTCIRMPAATNRSRFTPTLCGHCPIASCGIRHKRLARICRQIRSFPAGLRLGHRKSTGRGWRGDQPGRLGESAAAECDLDFKSGCENKSRHSCLKAPATLPSRLGCCVGTHWRRLRQSGEQWHDFHSGGDAFKCAHRDHQGSIVRKCMRHRPPLTDPNTTLEQQVYLLACKCARAAKVSSI